MNLFDRATPSFAEASDGMRESPVHFNKDLYPLAFSGEYFNIFFSNFWDYSGYRLF